MEDSEKKDALVDLFHVLETEQGRRVMRVLLSECRVYGSVASNNGLALREEHAVWYRAGRQDLGHFLMSFCAEANPVGFQKMNAEAYERKLKDEDKRVKGNKEKLDV
jgi:hypothetical protein